MWMRIRLGGCPGEVSICGGIKRLQGQGTHLPQRPPRGIDRYIRRTTYWHQLHRNRYVTPGGGTCTAESSILKVDHWGTLPVVPSHSTKVDAYVDSLVDGLQIANCHFHSRCSRCRYGRRPWDGIGRPPVCGRVRGRGVLNVGGATRGSDQTPGCNRGPSQLGGAGLHYFGRGTAEQLAAEGRPRGQKRDLRAYRYYCADKTMGPLECEAKIWIAALEKG